MNKIIYMGLFGRNAHSIVDQIVVTASNYEEAKQLLHDERNHYNYSKIVELKLSNKCKVTTLFNGINIKHYV